MLQVSDIGVPEMDGDFPVMESGATWTPLNNVRNSLIPGGWWLVAGGWLRCAGGASGAWPRPGHRNHPSYILGNGGVNTGDYGADTAPVLS